MNPGIDCLLSDTVDAAMGFAEQLESFNNQRRNLEGSMQSEALESVQAMDWESRATVTLFDSGWHQGVVGLVASRVKERIHRPVIAFAPSEDGELKGSGRSIEGVHLKDALDRVMKKDPDVIIRFGGHAMAAGLTIAPGNLERFSELFELAVSEMTPPELFDRTVLVDGALSPEEVNFPLIEALSSRIWGQGFERPLFANDFTILSQRVLKGTHLKLIVDLGGSRFEAIYFRHSEPLPQKVRLAYRPEINEFMGRQSVQLVVEASED
jgi:single-stranded-DNA-specific exonuclease